MCLEAFILDNRQNVVVEPAFPKLGVDETSHEKLGYGFQSNWLNGLI